MTTAVLREPPAAEFVPSRRVGPLAGLRHTLTLTWRSVLKIRTNAEDLLGLSLQPIMFLLLFVYVFGFTAMFPIIFASGLLVPIGTMPGWLQAFAKANPMTLLAEASRSLMEGGPVAGPTVKAMLWALGILVVFAPLAVRVYRSKT